jgi:branched-chain amino acid aminotransferase
MGMFASVNGVVTEAAVARVSVLDNGFTFGDAVYETLRTYGGRPFHLDRHLDRLRRSAAGLRIALPQADGELRARVDALLAASGNEESYLRIIVSRGVGDISYAFERVQGPTVVMVTKPYQPLPAEAYRDGVAVIVSSVRRNHPSALDPALKCCNLLNNALAMQEARERGALEPIMLNHEGHVAEGAGSNVFLVKDGSPRHPRPLPRDPGRACTRAVVLERAAGAGRAPCARPRPACRKLLAADEDFITSSLKELVPRCAPSTGGRSAAAAPAPVHAATLLAGLPGGTPAHCG